jgi:hypothetical protein
MRFALAMLAAVLIAVFSAWSPSVAQVTEPTDFVMGSVIELRVSFGAYQVEVLTTGQSVTIDVPQDLWTQLDVGDIMIHDADGWRLLHKGPMPDGELTDGG